MCKWSTGVPSVAGVLLLALIAYSPVTLSNPTVENNDRLGKYLPAKWRVVSPTFQAPQIEIKLLKGHVSDDEKLMGSIEYLFRNEDDQLPGTDEEPENWDTGNELQKGRKKSGLGSRTIIQTPRFGCPSGQKRDHLGNCREVFQLD